MYLDTGWFLARLLVFMSLNFSALFIGGYFTLDGVNSEWYLGLIKAPWSPSVYIFEVGWFIVMCAFSFFMAGMYRLYSEATKGLIIGFYILQWVLYVSWNPLFFYFHQVGLALIDLITLFLVITYFTFETWMRNKYYILLIIPYLICLLVTISMNAYIFFYN